MATGIYISMAGAVAQENALDVASNNLANVSTTGYRSERATFAETLGKSKAKANTNDSHFVAVGRTASDTSPGVISETGNPLDVAVKGDGFLAVQTPAGPRYTRDGHLQLDQNGTLVSADGFAVRGQGGAPIVAGKRTADVEIEPNGQVSADGKVVGQLELSRFAPAQLTRDGRNRYVAAGAPVVDPKAPVELEPESLEASNVNPVRSMVDLIRISRNYESLHRMIEANKEIDDRAARSIGNG